MTFKTIAKEALEMFLELRDGEGRDESEALDATLQEFGEAQYIDERDSIVEAARRVVNATGWRTDTTHAQVPEAAMTALVAAIRKAGGK